jgi:hypothetical protein
VSKLYIEPQETQAKANFINPIKWIFKCLSEGGNFGMGKLYRFGLLAVLPQLVVALSVVLLLVVAMGATTLEQLPFPEMVQKSTAIVRARVVGSTGVLRGSDVYTVYKLDPIEVWKAPAAGVPKEVAVPGGVAGGLRQPVDGAPSLAQGREYVLFLWTSRAGLTQLIGLSQGLFDVREDVREDARVGGDRMVWRAPASERMLDSAGRPVRDVPVSMKLADLKAQVARAVAGGR